jgi:hydrogenase maturation factor
MESFNKIEQAFIEFDTQNPEVYKQLVRLARQWRAAGKAKLGIKTLFEKLRWEWHVAGLTESDGYKLNNNFTALYARKIMKNEADLDGLFEIRSLASERSPMVWSNNL